MNNDLTITITVANGKLMVQPEKVATIAPAPAQRASKGARYVTGSKQACLEILMRRSHPISGIQLANMIGVSLGATQQIVYLLRQEGWRIITKRRKYKLVG